MALDVTVYNTFSSGIDGARSANYDAKDTSGTSKPNGSGSVPKKQGTTAQHSGNITLEENDYLEITVKDDSLTEKEFQISLKALTAGDYPVVMFQLSGMKWTLTNAGDNTGAQVGAGPDGQ